MPGLEQPETYLSPSDLRDFVIESRKQKDLKQKDIADAIDTTPSNISQAENNPEGRAPTLIRILEEITDYRFDENPRFKITECPERELNGETFESLSYHLRVLFFMHWGACALGDLQNQFPGYPEKGDEPHIETDEMRLRVGPVSNGAAIALQDLLRDGLVRREGFDVYSQKEQRERLKRTYQRQIGAELSKGQIEAAVEAALANDPGQQGHDCWYMKDGEKLSLDGKAVYCSFTLAEAGRSVITKMGHVKDRFQREEAFDQAPDPDIT